MDLGQAFRDTITWNGGPLTTHVCCSDSQDEDGRSVGSTHDRLRR
jgi:hypothetical protein